MTFGEKLRELRQSKEWTQKALADAAGSNQQSVGRWESGEQIPGFDAVRELCRALGVTCTVFDDCEFEQSADKRGPGRPSAKPKKEPEAKPATKRKPKKGA